MRTQLRKLLYPLEKKVELEPRYSYRVCVRKTPAITRHQKQCQLRSSSGKSCPFDSITLEIDETQPIEQIVSGLRYWQALSPDLRLYGSDGIRLRKLAGSEPLKWHELCSLKAPG